MTVPDFPPLPDFDPVPRQAVYLGLDPRDGHRPCWSSPEDSVGIVGPPRYGKSSGLIIPSLMTWDGPVVATSTRGDLLRAAGNWRRSLAAPLGGDVFVYDPIAPDPHGLVNQGHGNATARGIQIGPDDELDEEALLELFRAVIANNRAGGWRALSREGRGPATG